MKHLLLFAALLSAASCASPADKSRAAVSAYLKTKLDDPGSYTPVRWGPLAPFRQKTADSLAALALLPAHEAQASRAQQGLDSLRQTGLETRSPGYKAIELRGQAAAERADSIGAIGVKLLASKDSTRLGVVGWHSYRAKNKLGALVLDSSQFVVYQTGRVQAL